MLFARLTRWLAAPGVEGRTALLVLLFALPSLATGLACDDYGLAGRVRQSPLSGYSFSPRGAEAAHAWLLAERAAGRAPWWVGERLRVSFFRPLSSLSVWADLTLGAPPWWMHLENCLLYALTVGLAVRLYRRLGLSGAGLGWAAVFLGLDGGFSVSVGWISARNTLLAGLFGIASLLVHDRARRDDRPLLLAPACLLFALSLLSAELGLCTLGYLVAHAATVDRAAPTRRALALSPYAVVTAAYLAHYVAGGYGAHGVGGYRDVFGSPLGALLGLAESAPLWLASAVTVPFSGFVAMRPALRVPLVALSVAILAALVPLFWSRARGQPAARFFALGAALSLLPLSSPPGSPGAPRDSAEHLELRTLRVSSPGADPCQRACRVAFPMRSVRWAELNPATASRASLPATPPGVTCFMTRDVRALQAVLAPPGGVSFTTSPEGGVAHFWLVSPTLRSVEVLRRHDLGWLLVATFWGDAAVRAEPFDAVELELAGLWAP